MATLNAGIVARMQALHNIRKPDRLLPELDTQCKKRVLHASHNHVYAHEPGQDPEAPHQSLSKSQLLALITAKKQVLHVPVASVHAGAVEGEAEEATGKLGPATPLIDTLRPSPSSHEPWPDPLPEVGHLAIIFYHIFRNCP